MLNIVIDNNGTATSDIIEQLCAVELTQDVVIVTPYFEETDDDIVYEFDDFCLKNRNTIRPDRNSIYRFFPRIKISLPFGLCLQTYSKIPGLMIAQQSIEKIRGIELDEITLSKEISDINLSITAIKGEYTLYNKFIYNLKEYDRESFFNHLGEYRKGGLKIPERLNILGLNIIESFIGGERRFYNELYIIRSDYIFQRFPNF